MCPVNGIHSSLIPPVDNHLNICVNKILKNSDVTHTYIVTMAFNVSHSDPSVDDLLSNNCVAD